MATAGLAALLCISGVCVSGARAAGDRALGEYLSSQCATCHQSGGRLPSGIPAIVGLSEEQVIASMRAYKARQRDNQAMQAIAAGLSEDEIAALAAYYAALRPAN